MALVGIIIAIIGMIILVKSSNIFKKVDTTYINETPTAFVTEGLFVYSRNPMYLGALINIIGIVLFIGNAIGLFVPILFLVPFILSVSLLKKKLCKAHLVKHS